MSGDTELSKEENILRAVKHALTSVIKDTATPAGMIHPLKDATIQDLRVCLVLISARERELAEAAGRSSTARPRYADEAEPAKAIVHLVRKEKPTP
jgi:hypothetical protein